MCIFRAFFEWHAYCSTEDMDIPFSIQDDIEKAKRKRRRHTFMYVEEHSDAADKEAA